MTLSERLKEYVQACFTGIWIESQEHQDALAEISQLCRRENWRWATWDLEHGLRGAEAETGAADPLAAIRTVGALAGEEQTAVLVLQNFHRFMQSAEIVQALATRLVEGKHNRTFLVVLSPVVQIPIELERMFVVVEHELPPAYDPEPFPRPPLVLDWDSPSLVRHTPLFSQRSLRRR